MAIIKLSATEQRRASAFLSCLVLAVIAWIIVTLSKPFTYTIKQALIFKNAPQRRAFHSLQADTVSVTMKGSGWRMLFSKMAEQGKPIKVDLQRLEHDNFVVLSTQLDAINAAKDTNNRIIGFAPDTLYFDFSNRSTKRVPIHLQLSVKYDQQYAQSDNIIIKPAYVIVSGPSKQIEKITVWKTDSLTIGNVNETVRSEVNLEPVKEGNISIYPKTAQVIIPVNEFTEKTIEVPVKLVNNVNYYNVKVFPQKVKVTFTTSLGKFAYMDDDLFEADADLSLWKDHGYSALPVMLTKIPEFCKVVKIEPKNIDFIIKK